MANVRQLPELYLRGSLVTITIANLTKEQKEEVEAITLDIAYSPEMASHRIGMIKELKNTIAGDYKDDESTGVNEYLIAIYRGVADLLYHHRYTFCCGACGSFKYTTKQGRLKAIDRLQVPCPNCQKVLVVEAGDTTLKPGSYVTFNEFQDSYKHHNDQNTPPKMATAILAIKGEKKYPDPTSILNDPIQKKKLFGEYVWNYFRQHINENERKTHSKTTQMVTGTASVIYAESIATLLEHHKVQHTIHVKENGNVNLMLRSLEILPEITTEIIGLIQEAREKNARVTITTSEINFEGGETTTIERSKKDRVAVLESTTRVESDVDTIESVGHKSVGGAIMSQEDHVETVDAQDAISKVRDSLPDGNHQKVFSILQQHGELFRSFSDRFGDGQPKKNHIAEFLDIPTKTVENIIEYIRVLCLAQGLMP